MNKNYHLPVGVCALAVCLSLCFAVAAWDSPAGTPPGGNVAAPINAGAAAQTKTGDLSLGGKLNVVSDSASGRFCLDGECCATWEECATFAGTGCTGGCKLTPMSDVAVAGYNKYQCSDPIGFGMCNGFSKYDYWCPPGNCVIISQPESYGFALPSTKTKRVCAESGYELIIESSSQYNYTDCCTPDGGVAPSDFTEGLYICGGGIWVKTSD